MDFNEKNNPKFHIPARHRCRWEGRFRRAAWLAGYNGLSRLIAWLRVGRELRRAGWVSIAGFLVCIAQVEWRMGRQAGKAAARKELKKWRMEASR